MSDAPTPELDMPELRLVKSQKNVVGDIGFEAARLQMKDPATGNQFQMPVLIMATNMMTGESRQPIVLSPNLIVPLIANLATWLNAVNQEMMEAGSQVPGRTSEEVDPATQQARMPGETYHEWTERLTRIHLNANLEATEGKGNE